MNNGNLYKGPISEHWTDLIVKAIVEMQETVILQSSDEVDTTTTVSLNIFRILSTGTTLLPVKAVRLFISNSIFRSSMAAKVFDDAVVEKFSRFRSFDCKDFAIQGKMC